MSCSWLENLRMLSDGLHALSACDYNGVELPADAAIAQWKDRAQAIKEAGKTIYFIGNGASASMASHFSADLQKNACIHSHAYTDISMLTAYANDLSYEEVFAKPISMWMNREDMLVVISSSGESRNVLRAASVAREKQGFIVTLSAMNSNNSLRRCGDINFYLPFATYGLAETGHAAFLHFWADMLVNESHEK